MNLVLCSMFMFSKESTLSHEIVSNIFLYSLPKIRELILKYTNPGIHWIVWIHKHVNLISSLIEESFCWIRAYILNTRMGKKSMWESSVHSKKNNNFMDAQVDINLLTVDTVLEGIK